MNGEFALQEMKLRQVMEVLRELLNNEYLDLDDLCLASLICQIHQDPSVRKFNQLVADARWHLANSYPKPE